MPQFKGFRDHDFRCFVWFERDRQNVRLETPLGRVVFDLWDDDVSEAIQDGFLKPPRVPRPSSEDWQPCAVAYAREVGLIK